MQGDPFAAPSRVRVSYLADLASFASHRDDREAVEDFLLRRFGAALDERGPVRRGSGGSGAIRIYRPGPEICERSAVRLARDGTVDVRFTVGLPARGRRILGAEATRLLCQDVPAIVEQMRLDQAAEQALSAHVASVKRQRALRRALVDHELVAFIENGSVLPRTSGVAQAPLPGALPFVAPASLEVSLPTGDPDAPAVGMGIRAGVSLIVGGGFHGKSTVLQAVQRGHLDHIPGDGREGVVSVPNTVKIRAEDGRRITGVDISGFLADLPGGRPTAPFDTDDASGSTSQAAALVEALEVGVELLLLDEDTSATNLLVRDERMRKLIPADREPITPLVARVRELASRGVSTLMVVGGIGDWLAVADTVIGMDAFRPWDASERARALAGAVPAGSQPLRPPARRIVQPWTAPKSGKSPKIRARDTRSVRFGDDDIDLIAVEQVLDASHAWTLGHSLRFLFETLVDGKRSLVQLLDAFEAIVEDEGIEAVSPFRHSPGDLVRPRRQEVAAALNRLRSLAVRTEG